MNFASVYIRRVKMSRSCQTLDGMNELRGVADALHRRRYKRTAALARHRRPSGMVMAAIMNPKTVRVVDDIAPQGARAELRPSLGWPSLIGQKSSLIRPI
jgi:hypothetical protein